MRISKWFVGAGLGLALVAGLHVAQRASAADDEAANVRKSCSAFVTAWNKHDPKAMAAIFTEDATIVNPFGVKAKGRAEIEKLFTTEQTGPLKESSVEVLDEP